MKYATGYLPKINYYTQEIQRISEELQYCHPKSVGGLVTSLNNRMKRLEYFLNRHTAVNTPSL
jgi:hypothetical protein